MNKLDDYRKRVDRCTDKIVELIVEREEICREIGKYKINYHLPTYDGNREQKIFDRVEKRARELGLDEGDKNFLKDVFRLIIKRSKEVQEE